MAFSYREAFWSGRFRDAGDDYLFGTAPNRFLAEQAVLLPSGGRVLSVADGEGRNSVWLAEQGLKVTAVEVSPVGVEKARRLAAERAVEVDFVVADVFDWAWPEAAFDVVAAIFVQFAGPAERKQLFAAMRRALKPGGLLLLQGYTPKQLEYGTGGPPALEHLYTEALLREEFKAMAVLSLREYEDDLAEGAAHRGRSALIGLVARAGP